MQDLMKGKSGKSGKSKGGLGMGGKMMSPVTSSGDTPQSRIMLPKRKMKGKR